MCGTIGLQAMEGSDSFFSTNYKCYTAIDSRYMYILSMNAALSLKFRIVADDAGLVFWRAGCLLEHTGVLVSTDMLWKIHTWLLFFLN